MADWRLEGPYMKNCNCDPGCPCDFNADPTHGTCEGMAAMIVKQGHFDDVNLDGVKWAFKYWWPGALHEGHGAGQPILDASMSPEQMQAMGAILSGENGGTFYGILAEIIDTFHDPVIADIDIDIDVENRRARCAVVAPRRALSRWRCAPCGGDLPAHAHKGCLPAPLPWAT
jgi:hypothetical protein